MLYSCHWYAEGVAITSLLCKRKSVGHDAWVGFPHGMDKTRNFSRQFWRFRSCLRVFFGKFDDVTKKVQNHRFSGSRKVPTAQRAPHHQRRRNQPSELHGTNLNNSAQVVPLFLLLDTLSQRYRYRNNIPFTTPLPSHSFLHKIQIYLSTEQVKPSHVQASRPRRR